jgi:hypothetical protein
MFDQRPLIRAAQTAHRPPWLKVQPLLGVASEFADDGEGGNSRKRRKAPINNQLAPSGSGVPAANQETSAQATFTAMPRPEGMSDGEYGFY